jgi:hypothetical protein
MQKLLDPSEKDLLTNPFLLILPQREQEHS